MAKHACAGKQPVTKTGWLVFPKFFPFSLQTRRFSNHVSRLLSRSHTFAIIVILDLKIHQSMWIHWPFFPKTWTKGHWPLHDLWPHVCWGHMCDSTQGSLCPSPMTIHQCMWIQWSILQNTTYIHIHTTYYIHILHTEWVITYSLTELSSGETKMCCPRKQKTILFNRNRFFNQRPYICLEYLEICTSVCISLYNSVSRPNSEHDVGLVISCSEIKKIYQSKEC